MFYVQIKKAQDSNKTLLLWEWSREAQPLKLGLESKIALTF